MTNKDIEQLINKYLDGETSPAEECQLARELQHADIPEEWQAVRLMLGDLTLGEAEYCKNKEFLHQEGCNSPPSPCL